MKTYVTAATAVALALGVVGTPTGTPAPRPDQSCSRQDVAVTLTTGDAAKIAGWLCQPGRTRTKTVQLLVHGVTYDHDYWQSLGNTQRSYVAAALRQGRTTFAVDRLGTGASSHPAGDVVTFNEHAHVVRQVITALRDGRVGATRYQRVIGVGHSVGAGIMVQVAGTPGVRREMPDAVIVEDFMHDGNVPYLNVLNAARYPAQQDPKFTTAGLPTGYLTTPPGTRWLFHNPARVGAWVLERDEDRKQTITTGEAATLGGLRDATLSRAVDVPVLVAVGSLDRLYCLETTCRSEAVVRAREVGYYAAAPRFDVFVLRDAGHSLDLDPDADDWFTAAQRWVDKIS